ncbi:hypothetical protein TNCV_3255191 [Trichonephila clavipes]|nr:hypothetical protein TNCV_3255191 [Trichonephila clavipes]
MNFEGLVLTRSDRWHYPQHNRSVYLIHRPTGPQLRRAGLRRLGRKESLFGSVTKGFYSRTLLFCDLQKETLQGPMAHPTPPMVTFARSVHESVHETLEQATYVYGTISV